MVSFNLVLSLGLLGSAFTSAHPTRGGGPPGGSPPATYGCGEVDVFFTYVLRNLAELEIGRETKQKQCRLTNWRVLF